MPAPYDFCSCEEEYKNGKVKKWSARSFVALEIVGLLAPESGDAENCVVITIIILNFVMKLKIFTRSRRNTMVINEIKEDDAHGHARTSCS